MKFGSIGSWSARGVLREGAGGGGSGEGTGGAAPDAPTPGQPFAVFHTQDSFNDRIKRATRSELREQFGTDDPAEIKRRLDRAKELEDAEAARVRETQTKEQQLQSDLERERAARTAAEQERDARRFEAHVNDLCAHHKITNTKYARFLVSEAAEALPAGQQLDAGAFLEEALKNPQYCSAFGIVEAPPATQQAPVTTSPTPAVNPPPPPNNGAPAPSNVMTMGRREFQEHLAKIGV